MLFLARLQPRAQAWMQGMDTAPPKPHGASREKMGPSKKRQLAKTTGTHHNLASSCLPGAAHAESGPETEEPSPPRRPPLKHASSERLTEFKVHLPGDMGRATLSPQGSYSHSPASPGISARGKPGEAHRVLSHGEGGWKGGGHWTTAFVRPAAALTTTQQ